MDIWHKIEEGSFDKKGKSYDYVIEQNKNVPIEQGTRIRIVKTYPKVKAIRTRYEPHVEVDGEAGAYVPSYFGYNMKRLVNWKGILILNSVMIISILILFGIDIFKGINIVPVLNIKIPKLMTQLIFTFFVIFVLLLPANFGFYQRIKLYFRLKKEGIDYEAIKNG